MLFNSTTKPTLTTYALSLLLFCMAFMSYGQAVEESFEGFTTLVNGDYTYNNFELIGCRSTNLAYTGLSALRFFDSNSSLEYVGCDGDGKDGGIRQITFAYKKESRFVNSSILRVQVNGVNVGSINVSNRSYLTTTIDVNNPSDNLKVRFYFSSGTGRVDIDDIIITNGLGVETRTWNGSAWSVSAPDADDIAIINANYDTLTEGSFSAGSLIINSGNNLTVNNGDFVDVKNNVTVEDGASIDVETQGSFVQRGVGDAAGCFTLKGAGTAKVRKKTSSVDSPAEYTYWSSPVSGETIANGLLEANLNNVYSFSGQNYKDSDMLINNVWQGVDSGQDDIDDDYNDWQSVAGSTEMVPGVGYAATHSTSFPAMYPNPGGIGYEFEGAFNNGDIEVPIYRNDAEMDDNNWNFIGNPYSSAIDADVFLGANTSVDQSTDDFSQIVRTLDGAIFFWSHATAASTSANGNNASNYAQNDYAIINGVGQIHGGDGVLPTRHIPSGQGFFVSMDDGATPTSVSGDIKSINVVFNNDMRVTGNNNQFFRSSGNTDPNKLWINLSSDNGVRNQILVAYANGATDNFDGMYYDTYKNLSTDINAEIYTKIEDSGDKKFAIQGKDPNSLSLDEVIPFGFNTSIAVPTLYTISIGQFEGAFMTANTIYLKDNLLNTIHNLKDSDYSFTSDAGEFNERFEIVFTTDALSIDENVLDANALTITELTDTDVAFNVGKAFSIANVKIFDLLGRQIYDLEGSSSREVYNLAKLSKAAYIAKVTLDNGQVISKKAIKQK